jgi:hypothetical protein
MFNHNRGLWGYTGIAADGEPLTIQCTGMAGPSAAIVLEELVGLGVRRAVRGRGRAARWMARPRSATSSWPARPWPRTGRAGARGGRAGRRDPGLTAALGGAPALVADDDLFYERDPAREAAWRARRGGARGDGGRDALRRGGRAGSRWPACLAVTTCVRRRRASASRRCRGGAGRARRVRPRRWALARWTGTRGAPARAGAALRAGQGGRAWRRARACERRGCSIAPRRVLEAPVASRAWPGARRGGRRRPRCPRAAGRHVRTRRVRRSSRRPTGCSAR